MTDEGPGEPTDVDPVDPVEPAPAGWYADAQGDYRWWDGAQWTQHTLPPPPTGSPASPASPEPLASPQPASPTSATSSTSPTPTAAGASPVEPVEHDRGRGRLVALLVVAALVVAAVAIGLAVVLTRDDGDTVADDRDASADPTVGTTSATPTPTPTSPPPTSATATPTTPTPTPTPPSSPPAPTGPPDPRSTPEGTVTDVFTKYFDRDCTLVRDTTARFQAERKLTAATCRPGLFGPQDLDCTVGAPRLTVAGDTARGTYRFSGAGCAQRGTVELVRDGGLWLLDVVRPRVVSDS